MIEQHTKSKANITGFGAILLWGGLALLTACNSRIPTFQLTAMAFFIAFLAGAIAFIRTGCNFSVLRQPPRVWINGILGLFGYHALYFMAMRSAPAVEANLINYLWPVLIVLFSAFLPGEKLRPRHVLGVLLGFCGVAVLLSRGGALRLDARYLPGYLLAMACAVVWAVYSVLSRKFSNVPTLLIGAFCGATALLSLLCHLLLEETVWPYPAEWLTIMLMGLGPVGLAFYAWDAGVKHGDLRLLGTLSYIVPLLSSVLLVCFGKAQFSWNLLGACVLIVAGSLVSAFGVRRRKRTAEE